MRIIAVLMGIVALVVFSIFLLLAAQISQRPWTTASLTGFEEHTPPTGAIYFLSHVAVRHLWLYVLLVVAVCTLMVVGVLQNRIGDVTVWAFFGCTVLLNVLAIVSIRLVADALPTYP